MFSQKIRVCELFGIPIYLDFSLIILLLLFTSGGSFLLGIANALILLVSITAHELGHSLTARAFGYRTNDITLSLLGGCASLIALPRKASQEFFTAIAGPAVSFLLAAGALAGVSPLVSGDIWGFVVYVLTNGLFGNPELYVQRDVTFLAEMLIGAGMMNLMLGSFNLLPGFPMDGGRIFRSAMRAFMTRARATYIAMVVGRGFSVLLALYAIHRIFNRGSWGFVTLLIAWMIWREGWREYQQALVEEQWGGPWDWSARVSPPPYGGDEDDIEIHRHRGR